MNIDPVEDRSRDLGLIFVDLPQRTPASLPRISEVSAQTRVRIQITIIPVEGNFLFSPLKYPSQSLGKPFLSPKPSGNTFVWRD